MVKVAINCPWRRIAAALGDTRGITSLEYAVLALGIVLVIVAAARTIGTDVSTLFGTVGSAV